MAVLKDSSLTKQVTWHHISLPVKHLRPALLLIQKFLYKF